MTERPVPTTRYINTDLDVAATDPLNWLVEFFARRKTFCLAHRRAEDGRWYAVFEYGVNPPTPEATVVGLLEQIEAMKRTTRVKWNRCSSIEFNLGYDVGDAPWAFNDALKPGTLKRIASAGATIRWTLYPLGRVAGSTPHRHDDTGFSSEFEPFEGEGQPRTGGQSDDLDGAQPRPRERARPLHRAARSDFLANLVTHLTIAARGEYADLDSVEGRVGVDVQKRVKGYNELTHRLAAALRGGFPNLCDLDEVLSEIAAHYGLIDELTAATTRAYSLG